MAIPLELDDWRPLLVQQYGESSRLRAWIENLATLLDGQTVDPLNRVATYLDPNIAPGRWLDFIGDRLGFIRPQTENLDQKYFGFDTPDDSNIGYDQGPIKSTDPQLVVTVGIADPAYARMLLARAWFVRSTGTAAEIQRAVDLLFTGGGTVTEGNFSVSIVAVEPRNTVWAATLEHAAQLIPRPAGVSLTLTRAMS